jgi:hypothetical protein
VRGKSPRCVTPSESAESADAANYDALKDFLSTDLSSVPKFPDDVDDGDRGLVGNLAGNF